MQTSDQQILTCPTCGGVLEETFGGGLGCMVCLLRVGIGGEDDASPNSIAPGNRRFGIYEIERHPDGSLYELGRGGMGVMYRAIDTSLQREVALKIIKISAAGRSAEARQRFMREARTTAALRHENIATVFQFGIREETGQCFYAMELIEGETLDERVRCAGPLSARTTIDIAQQVTAALVAAEKRGLIHRDLKPANLMLVSTTDDETGGANPVAPSTATQRRGDSAAHVSVVVPLRRGSDGKDEKFFVKIIDFGLAKALNTQTDPMSVTQRAFVGTPAFASPEQFEHSALDVRSDIYSLGETLWFALTGKTPFAGLSAEEIHRAQQSNALPTQQLKAAHVPARLRSLLKSMLALEPAARPGTQELTARLQHCAAEASGVRSRRIVMAAVVISVLGVSAFFVFPALRTPLETAGLASNPASQEKSIAVLPFENLGRDPDNSFFGDGVQDEILNNLAMVADLKVIGHTSVMQYKTGVARNLRKIGKELGVAHLVEGSVQRSGNRVRVNVQLVHARTDRRLWGETYDGDLTDVFGIQSRIAMTIANELHAELSANEKSEIERPATNDFTAFDLYTRAKKLVLTPGLNASAKPNWLRAVDLLSQSVVRDPSFFRGYCQLVFIHDALYFFGHDQTPARLALAEAALQAASRLRPDAGETHLARAWNLYWGYLDYDSALDEAEVAHQTLPNDPQILYLNGLIQRRQGQWEESIRTLERAADLDPRNFEILQQVAVNYAAVERYSEEQLWLRRVLAVEPEDAGTKVILAAVDFERRADTQPLHQMIDSVRTANPAAVPDIADWWLQCALAERDAAAAKDALVAAGENPINLGNDLFSTHLFVVGLIAQMTKDDDIALSAFTAARAEQAKIVQAQPNFGPAWCVLGLIDAALGRREEALLEGLRAVELLPVEKDALRGPAMIKYLAMIAAWVGDKDLACEQLAVAVVPPSPVTYGQLKLLPFWDSLRGDPRFEQIVASLAPK